MPSLRLGWKSWSARSCIVFPPVQHHSVMFGINPTILSSRYFIFSTLALELSDHFANAYMSSTKTSERAHIPKQPLDLKDLKVLIDLKVGQSPLDPFRRKKSQT